MGALGKIVLSIVTIGIAFSFQYYRDLTKPLKRSEIDDKFYWGPGDQKLYKEDKTVKPFKINYSDEVIQRLKSKILDSHKFHEPLEETAFEYGFNSNKLSSVLEYWTGTYLTKWTERQSYLNKFPQFKTQIQGLNIHFIHVKPKVLSANTKILPLLLLHGWPGSIREFYDVIEMLTEKSNEKFAFEIIVPSLPGYGFSQGSSKKNFGPIAISAVMKNLMLRLGFNKFYAQGGDWGSVIGSSLVTFFPDHILGYHSNMCGIMTPASTFKTIVASYFPSYFIEEEFVDFYYPFSPKISFLFQESGYMHIQSTKPDTIGTALTDNPIGLAVYIIEKFSTWTNPEYRSLKDGGLEKYFTMDGLLDNIMIYYLSNSITTSMRLYSEAFSSHEASMNMDRVPTSVPVACARFKHEITHQFDYILKSKFKNLIQSTHHNDGGHFAAMQLPKVFYKDFIEFIKKTLE